MGGNVGVTKRLVLLAVAVGATACGGTGAGSDDAAGTEVGADVHPDGEVDSEQWQPDCHKDCAGGAQCLGGKVHVFGLGPKWCNYPNPDDCTVDVFECPHGCIEGEFVQYRVDPKTLCSAGATEEHDFVESEPEVVDAHEAMDSDIAPTCTFPTTWGKAGVVTTLATPGLTEAEFLKTHCVDYSGNGSGDNGLKALASTINPEIAKAAGPGELGIVEFRGATDLADMPSFTLVVLLGRLSEDGSGSYLIDPASFDLATPSGECRPLYAFDGAKIVSGKVSAGPGEFTLPFPAAWLGWEFSLPVQQAQVSATLTDGQVEAASGVLGFYVTKEAIDSALVILEQVCLTSPDPPPVCTPIGQVSLLSKLLDLDLNKDGKKDAASVCFRFTLTSGTIAGMETK
jgi:hypothetical protein